MPQQVDRVLCEHQDSSDALDEMVFPVDLLACKTLREFLRQLLDKGSEQGLLACGRLHHRFASDVSRQFLTQYLRRHRVVPHLPQCELSTKKILLHPCHLE